MLSVISCYRSSSWETPSTATTSVSSLSSSLRDFLSSRWPFYIC
jgi:hypothetical protein